MHTLLERQLRKAGFKAEALPTDLEAWQAFLTRVERSYKNADNERLLWQAQAQQAAQQYSPQAANKLQQLDTVLSSLTAGICAFDLDDKLLFINQTAQHYLQLSPQQTVSLAEILTHFTWSTAPDTEHTELAELVQQAKTGYQIDETHLCLAIAADNAVTQARELPVVFKLSPIEVGDKLMGIVLWFEDISTIKQAEAELVAAKEAAEHASSSKSKFLSSMSHELRTPMNAILGYSEILQEDIGMSAEKLGEETTEDMQQYVANILQAAWHLLELINKVLDLSRIEAGKLEITIEAVDVIDLIKECVSIVLPAAEKRQIKISNYTESMTPQEALVDRGRLKQVIINLLSNAVKYNREAGSIYIRLSQASRRYFRLEIEDTGEGLDAEQQAQIFEPFTRLSGVNLIEGTGIGLTITKQLMELMDGHIGVDSQVGVGSNFWLEVPITTQPDADTATVNIEELSARKFMLLYIEDSRTNVSLVAQVLKARPDIALISAHTGEMGLELAKMHKPTVILLDINLPGMSGFDVMRALKIDDDTQHIPVLALSAMDSEKSEIGEGEDGFFRYIVKPLDIKTFLTTIDAALEHTEQHETV